MCVYLPIITCPFLRYVALTSYEQMFWRVDVTKPKTN